MSLNRVVLLLGTNLGDRKINLSTAKELINSDVGEILKESKIIETKPEGFTSSNLFLNQTILLDIGISPIKLLEKVKAIEQKMGRKYYTPKDGEKYTDRLIDVDVLIYNNLIFRSEKLTLPHNQIFEREFINKILFFS